MHVHEIRLPDSKQIKEQYLAYTKLKPNHIHEIRRNENENERNV